MMIVIYDCHIFYSAGQRFKRFWKKNYFHRRINLRNALTGYKYFIFYTEEQPNPGKLQDSNPWPLGNEWSVLPLCYQGMGATQYKCLHKP